MRCDQQTRHRRSSRHHSNSTSNSSSIALTYDFRDTTKMFDRSIEGQIHRVWHKLPEGLIEQGKSKGWLSITKGSQRYLAGKTMAQGCK